MNATAKTFGALGLALLGLVVYLGTFLLGKFGLTWSYNLFWLGLVLTFVLLAVVAVLAAAPNPNTEAEAKVR